jgi:hypothetical protein
MEGFQAGKVLLTVIDTQRVTSSAERTRASRDTLTSTLELQVYQWLGSALNTLCTWLAFRCREDNGFCLGFNTTILLRINALLE